MVFCFRFPGNGGDWRPSACAYRHDLLPGQDQPVSRRDGPAPGRISRSRVVGGSGDLGETLRLTCHRWTGSASPAEDFRLECSNPAVPLDGSNLVLKAAQALPWPPRAGRRERPLRPGKGNSHRGPVWGAAAAMRWRRALRALTRNRWRPRPLEGGTHWPRWRPGPRFGLRDVPGRRPGGDAGQGRGRRNLWPADATAPGRLQGRRSC